MEKEIKKRYYNLTEAAVELEVSKNQLRGYITHLGIKLNRSGRRLYLTHYSMDKLDAFLSKPFNDELHA